MIFHAWSLYPIGALTWWWYWLIRLLVLAYSFCSSHDYPGHFDMYLHFVVSLICLSVHYLAFILSWSYLSMLSLLLFILIVIFSFSLCVDMDDILALYLTALLLCVCMLFVCVGCTFILFTSNPLVSVISFLSILIFASVRPCVYMFLWLS